MRIDSSDGVVDIVRQAPIAGPDEKGLPQEERRALADGADGSYTVGDDQ